MNTSAQVVQLLQQAIANTQAAHQMIGDLIADHEYEDVATLVAQAAEAVLQSAVALMQSDSEAAFDALERADDLFDAVYGIIDSELDDE